MVNTCSQRWRIGARRRGCELAIALVVASGATAHAAPLPRSEAGPPDDAPQPPTSADPAVAPDPADPAAAPDPAAPTAAPDPVDPAAVPAPARAARPLQLTPPGLVPPISSSAAPGSAQETTPSALAQVLVGGALGAAGLFGGAFVGLGLDCASHCTGDFAGLGGLLVGAGVGLTVATTAGVMLVGSDHAHESSIALTWLGTVAGGLGGLAILNQMSSNEFVRSPAGAITILSATTALGGTVMFRLARMRRPTTTAVALVPFASGGGLGLSLVGQVR